MKFKIIEPKGFFNDKRLTLYLVLSAVFLTSAVTAEIIGVKAFSFEKIIGIEPIPLPLFSMDSISLPAGYILWPVVFIFTDIMNEYFGKAGVKKISWLTAVMISFVFLFLFIAALLPSPDSWVENNMYQDADKKIYLGDISYWVNKIFNNGIGIIIGSLLAFLVGQLLDARLFQMIKKLTKGKYIWLRATGSTFISQVFDSYIVVIVAFYVVPMLMGYKHENLSVVIGWGTIGYIYKVTVAIILTPAIYLAHNYIDKYLGKELLDQMHFEFKQSVGDED